MKKYCVKKSRFTLVELLVAMGVFCLLLMVSMQIFGGAQKLWVTSEQKNNVFASARTAMEFVASRIQSNAYTENMPFAIYGRKTVNSVTFYEKIYFPTVMPMNRKDNSGNERDRYNMRFIGFSVNSDGILQMRIYSDEKNNAFVKQLPPYRRGKTPTYSGACSNVQSKIDNASEHNLVDIAEYVTRFRLIPFNTTGASAGDPISKSTSDSTHRTPPYLVEIEISMLDSKESFARWKNGSDNEKAEIEQESGFTFRRAVLLGDRRNRE